MWARQRGHTARHDHDLQARQQGQEAGQQGEPRLDFAPSRSLVARSRGVDVPWNDVPQQRFGPEEARVVRIPAQVSRRAGRIVAGHEAGLILAGSRGFQEDEHGGRGAAVERVDVRRGPEARLDPTSIGFERLEGRGV